MINNSNEHKLFTVAMHVFVDAFFTLCQLQFIANFVGNKSRETGDTHHLNGLYEARKLNRFLIQIQFKTL